MRACLFLLLFSLVPFAIGCAHGGELFGFPPTGSDTAPTPTPSTGSTASSAPDDEAPAPSIIRARVRTQTPTADINRTGCSLQPSLPVAGESRAVDVYIGGVTPCGTALEGAIRLNLRVMDDEGRREVVLELLVPQGTTPSGAEDMKSGLREIEREFARRLASLERAEHSTRDVPSANPWVEPHPKSAKVLFVSEILWAVTAGIGATGALMIVGGAARSGGSDSGWIAAGSGTLVFGAAPMFLASLTTLIVAGALYAGEN